MSEICEIGCVKDIRGRAMKKHKATSVCTGCFFYDKPSCPGQDTEKPIESGGSECYGTIWKPAKSTQKPKEPKTMTTKKPGTSHGKPTANGLRVEKKPTAAKVSKYPAPRVQREIETKYGRAKKTKAQLIDCLTWTAEQFHNLAADHCIAGTKLDRALVDLKEAKKRIKELETLNAAATRIADDQRTEINRLQGARK